MEQRQMDFIAAQGLLAGARPRDLVDLLDNLERWERLGLVGALGAEPRKIMPLGGGEEQ